MTSPAGAKSWKEELKEVWPYAIAVTTVLFFTSTLTAWFVTWQAGPSNYVGYVFAAADPAFSAVFMILICFVRPVVFTGPTFVFPHALSLPTVYMSIIYGFKLLGRDAATVQRYETVERFDLIWLKTDMVVGVWIGMIIVLSAIGAFKPKANG